MSTALRSKGIIGFAVVEVAITPYDAHRLFWLLKLSVTELSQAALSVDLLNYQAKTISCSVQSLPRKMLHKRVYETYPFRSYRKFFNASRPNRPLNKHPPLAACKRGFRANSWTNTNPTPGAKPGATNKKGHSRRRKWPFGAPSWARTRDPLINSQML